MALAAAIAIGLVIVAIVELVAPGPGTCAVLADKLWLDCWGTRLLRSLTGWPTHVAAATISFTYATLATVCAVAAARYEFDEPDDPRPARSGRAWLYVPLATGIGCALLVHGSGSSLWDSLASAQPWPV